MTSSCSLPSTQRPARAFQAGIDGQARMKYSHSGPASLNQVQIKLFWIYLILEEEMHDFIDIIAILIYQTNSITAKQSTTGCPISDVMGIYNKSPDWCLSDHMEFRPQGVAHNHRLSSWVEPKGHTKVGVRISMSNNNSWMYEQIYVYYICQRKRNENTQNNKDVYYTSLFFAYLRFVNVLVSHRFTLCIYPGFWSCFHWYLGNHMIMHDKKW